MLAVFFVVPFGIMVAISFFNRVQGGFYTPAFVFDNYARFLTRSSAIVLGFSLWLAALVAVICVAIALPFTYLLRGLPAAGRSSGWSGCWRCCRCRRSSSASPGRRCFSRPPASPTSWSVGADGRAAIADAELRRGADRAWSTRLPYAVLVLYPALSRLDPSLVEAARTLGASPLRAFFNRRRAGAAERHDRDLHHGVRVRARLLPAAADLGRPQHWTLSC
jgi:putative spermidine/putrescine transport system permease protein